MADYIIQDTTLTAIADAVRGKTGDVSVMTPMEMVSAIEGISTGGGGSSGGEEWIGDGNTHIWISLEEGRTSPMIGVGVVGTVTVDWGDGSTPDVLTGNNPTGIPRTPKHEYGKAGDYVITLTVVDGYVGISGNSNGCRIIAHDETGSNIDTAYRSSIKKIEFGTGIESIGSYAFCNCYSLADIIFSEGPNSISSYAFQNCYSLKRIVTPKSVKGIGNGSYLFQNCYSLKSAVILNATPTTTIGNAMFQGCYSLASIVVQGNITSVSANAFKNCYALRLFDFTSHTKVPTLANTSAFTGIPADCEIRVPAALAEEWKAATNWSTYASYIVGV
jgi:hypothetical protein